MKKLIAATLFILSFAGLFGCSPEEAAESSVSETASVMSSAESSEESSENSIPQSSVEESSLPAHVVEDRKGYLKFTGSSGNISAVFPDDFSVLCTEYTPSDGIYLQNSDGTATLQIEAIENEGIDRETLVDYLEDNYSDAEVYVNDSKNIICKSAVTDGSGNKSVCYMKAVITEKGYNEAILYFKQSEKSKYEALFNKISIS